MEGTKHQERESNKKRIIDHMIWNAPLENGFFVERPSLNKQIKMMLMETKKTNSSNW